MKYSHVPLRTCRACGQRGPKSELCRFIDKLGEIVEDSAQVLVGRGVYCCANEECLKRLKKNRKVLNKALRIQG